MNWPVWLFVIAGVVLLALILMTKGLSIFIGLLAVTLWLGVEFDVWPWVPWAFWLLVILTGVFIVLDIIFGDEYLDRARWPASLALLIAVTVVVVDGLTTYVPEWFDDDDEQGFISDMLEDWHQTILASINGAVEQAEEASTTTVKRTTTTSSTSTEAPAITEAPAPVVVCERWTVTQSDPATTKWLEDGLTPDNVEVAQQELLAAIKAHHDLLGGTVIVFAEALRIDPTTVDWETYADADGCITPEGRDLYYRVETLLLAQKWVWQQPCVVDHSGTGITTDGNIVRRDGLGRVADYGCYVFVSVTMGEDPTDPNAEETGIVIGSVSKFCGNINPPGKPPHIPPGPTPEPPPEEPTPTTTVPPTTPGTTTVTTTPGSTTTTMTGPPDTVPTTTGRKANVPTTVATSQSTIAPPASAVVVTPPPTSPPDETPDDVIIVDSTPAPVTSTPNGNTGGTLPATTAAPASTTAPAPAGGGTTAPRP